MIKRLFLVLITSGALLFTSCSDTKDKKTAKDDDKIEKEDDKKVKEDNTEDKSDLAKAATGFCDCFNETGGEINPRMKKIIMKAAESDNPPMVIQQEIMKIEGEQEREQFAKEFQEWSENKEMESCSNKVKAKYDIKENDLKTQKAVLKILEDRGDCEFLASMLRMAMKMKGDTKEDDTKNDDTEE